MARGIQQKPYNIWISYTESIFDERGAAELMAENFDSARRLRSKGVHDMPTKWRKPKGNIVGTDFMLKFESYALLLLASSWVLRSKVLYIHRVKKRKALVRSEWAFVNMNPKASRRTSKVQNSSLKMLHSEAQRRKKKNYIQPAPDDAAAAAAPSPCSTHRVDDIVFLLS